MAGRILNLLTDRIPDVMSVLLSLQAKYSDWKDFLVKRLTGARTLPINFYKVCTGNSLQCVERTLLTKGQNFCNNP